MSTPKVAIAVYIEDPHHPDPVPIVHGLDVEAFRTTARPSQVKGTSICGKVGGRYRRFTLAPLRRDGEPRVARVLPDKSVLLAPRFTADFERACSKCLKLATEAEGAGTVHVPLPASEPTQEVWTDDDGSLGIACECGWVGGPYATEADRLRARGLHACQRYRSQKERAERARKRAEYREDREYPEPVTCPHTPQHRHGTDTAYRRDGCRCRECAYARARSESSRRRRLRTEGPQIIDADPVREHIATLLQEPGVTLKAIATVARVSPSVVDDFSPSAVKRGHTPGIHRRVSRAILSTSVGEVLAVPVTSGARVDGLGTQRRVRALYAVGWSYDQIGAVAGISARTVSRIARTPEKRTQARVAQAVKSAFDRMSGFGPSTFDTPDAEREARRRRETGARLGWAPPAAWTNPDDPREVPRGLRREP